MNRPWQIWVLYALCLAVSVPAMAWLTIKACQLDKAEAISLQLLEKDPAHPDGLNVLARIAAHRGEPHRAVELAQRSLEADPYNLEARRILEAIGRSPK